MTREAVNLNQRDPTVREIVDRMRRLETRVTRWLEAQGFDTQTQVPTFNGSVVELPSTTVAFDKITAALPADMPGVAYPVVHKGMLVGYVSIPPTRS